jgi:hypothetical protein
MKDIIILALLFFSSHVFSADSEVMKDLAKDPSKITKIKYKEAGRIDFESLLIEGERKKPELSVVTGNIGEKDNGLMVIRKDFGDMMANDFGEIIE